MMNANIDNENRWTRRQFMKLTTLTTLQAVIGCSPNVMPIEGKPLHHTTGGFRNYPPAPEPETPGFSFLFRRVKEGFSDPPQVPEDHVINEAHALSKLNNYSGSEAVTWIGHSTYLMRLGNKNILFDPFFSDLASPLPVGPVRFVPPGISLAKLPRIDVIIISHNHYDHLDSETVETMAGKEKIHVFVPLGLKTFFAKRGYQNIQELDWHQSVVMDGLKMTALPAVHFSSRGLGDHNKTLWCSWAVRSENKSCFFAGDTAYSPTIFKEIGKRFQSFDVAIVPIGAYEPVNVMKPVHTNPEEAILVANDVKADLIIPSHWGTIVLTDESPWEPPERYRAFAVKNGISDDRACIMKIGETRGF
jgi:N-acyl-phosphatidylethanolamine-hydrolysing phospholipase D